MKLKLPVNRIIFCWGIVCGVLVTGWQIQAETFTENFASTDNAESYDMLWNTELGQLQPPLQINNINPVPATQSLDFGDGRHGVFDVTTYANFSTGGDISGNTIRLDTDTWTELQVTSFTLEAPWTIEVSGSNPLIIKSLSDITIQAGATINCSGGNGEDQNGDINTITVGGQGRCGGGDGGDGGSNAVLAEAGVVGGASLGAAGAGVNSTINGGEGGGGGGAYRDPGAAAGTLASGGVHPIAGGTAAGTNFQDDAFTEFGGGSGGSGGAPMLAGGNQSAGGAGGGGGGLVQLLAIQDILLDGDIFANGGDGGGDGGGAFEGGGGGAGGGGSIMAIAGNLLDFGGNATAIGGTGGTTNSPTTPGIGGDGSDGRTWLTDSVGAGTYCNGCNDDPITLLLDEGRTESIVGTYTATSNVIDLNSSRPMVTSVNVTKTEPGGSTVTVELATGDSSDFDASGSYAEISTYVGQTLSRYIKIRITMDNQSTSPGATISEVSVEYDRGVVGEFDFAAGCGKIAGSPPASLNWSWLFLIFLPMVIVSLTRKHIYE